ncbi:ATP-binding protein [Streptomyces sp. NPDC056019]|uniref:ATP-binding protein n=1 Tax=Streptomyces sp. NPDC056019 TaxID=3345681 RepID=UPI0035DBC148
MDTSEAGRHSVTAVPGEVPHQVVTLPADDTCMGQARRVATDFLTRARVDHGLAVTEKAEDLTRLVVSELVTNAHKYVGGPVLMELSVVDAHIEVVVRDRGTDLPVARTADAGRVGQHGLEIVMAVAQSVVARREPGGKSVTARLPLE